MEDDKIKVLYIAGWGRSGSTILGNILGHIDGFFSVGELRYIWDRGLIENRLCGCGIPFTECEMWKQVLDEAFGGMDQIDAHEMIHLRESVRTRHTLLSLVPQGKRLLSARLGKYPDSLQKLYQAIQSRTGSRVIVDSSKFPSHGYVLGMIPTVDLYVVHLTRDPRAVSFSWLKKKIYELSGDEPIYISQHSPIRNSWLWSTWNIIAEMLWKHQPNQYLMLRYEDFIDKPKETVRCILDLVQESAVHLPFVTEREVKLGVNHTISGNPVRFQTGRAKLQLDAEWKVKMKRSDRIIVTVLTWPLLLRYGYLGNVDKQ